MHLNFFGLYHDLVLGESDGRPHVVADLVPDLELDLVVAVSCPGGHVVAVGVGAARRETELVVAASVSPSGLGRGLCIVL